MDTGGKATVKTFDGLNWNSVGPRCFSSAPASYLTLSVDQNGNPFVAYSDTYNRVASVLAFNGAAWVPVGTNISPARFDAPSLAFDITGTPYVAYNNTETFVRQYGCLYAGVNETSQPAHGLNIYPNPSEGEFEVETTPAFPDTEHAELLVYTVTGKLIMQLKTTGPKTRLSLSDQPDGLYFVCLKTQHGLASFSKVIKSR